MSNSEKIVGFSRSPVVSDYQRDDRESEKQIASLKRAFQSNPPSPTPVLSDYEKDDRESELQIEAFARLVQERKARQALAIADDAGGGP